MRYFKHKSSCSCGWKALSQRCNGWKSIIYCQTSDPVKMIISLLILHSTSDNETNTSFLLVNFIKCIQTNYKTETLSFKEILQPQKLSNKWPISDTNTSQKYVTE